MIPEAAEAGSKRTMEKLIFALCKGAPVGRSQACSELLEERDRSHLKEVIFEQGCSQSPVSQLL